MESANSTKSVHASQAMLTAEPFSSPAEEIIEQVFFLFESDEA